MTMSKAAVSSRLALFLAVAGALVPLAASAQSQDSPSQSVAEAARKAREQKKAQAKPATVITEDTLKAPTPPEKAVEAAADAQSAPNPADTPAPDAAAKPAAKPQGDKNAGDDKKKHKAELEALKQQLTAAKKSLDLLQRELALDQDTYFSNPEHDRDAAGKAKLDGVKQRISDKEQEVDVLKTRVAALEELAGTEAAASPPPQQ
jgi:hypothetical protein